MFFSLQRIWKSWLFLSYFFWKLIWELICNEIILFGCNNQWSSFFNEITKLPFTWCKLFFHHLRPICGIPNTQKPDLLLNLCVGFVKPSHFFVRPKSMIWVFFFTLGESVTYPSQKIKSLVQRKRERWGKNNIKAWSQAYQTTSQWTASSKCPTATTPISDPSAGTRSTWSRPLPSTTTRKLPAPPSPWSTCSNPSP